MTFRQDPLDTLHWACEAPLGQGAHEERQRIYEQMTFHIAGKTEKTTMLDCLFEEAARRFFQASDQGEFCSLYPGTWQYIVTTEIGIESSFLRFTDPGIAMLFKLRFG